MVGASKKLFDNGPRPGSIKQACELLDPEWIEVELPVKEFLEDQIVQEAYGPANSRVSVYGRKPINVVEGGHR